MGQVGRVTKHKVRRKGPGEPDRAFFVASWHPGLVLWLLISVVALISGATPANAQTACPIYWHPGEPSALFPHEEEVTGGSSPVLDAESTRARLSAARLWVEVGQPKRTLELLESVPSSAQANLYRLAALVSLGRWSTFEAAADTAGLPPGCQTVADLWRARGSARRGDWSQADRLWSQVSRSQRALTEYVELWRLENAAWTGDVSRGEVAWARISDSGLPKVVRDDGQALMALLYDRAGEPGRARERYLALARESSGVERARYQLTAAQQADIEGRAEVADDLRRKVISEEPAEAVEIVRDEAIRARLGLSGSTVARVLLAAGRSRDAAAEATAVIGSGASGETLRSAYLIRARALAASGNRSRAEADYATILETWASHPEVPQIWYERARLALRSGDGMVGRQRLSAFVEAYPGDQRADDALYLIADSYQDDRQLHADNADQAIESFDELRRRWPRSYFADRSYMRAAHLLYSMGRYREAEQRYAAYSGNRSRREGRYWRARAAADLGEATLASEILEELVTAGNRDYYTLLALRELEESDAPLFAQSGRPTRPMGGDASVILEEPVGDIASALLAVGERRYARAELARAIAGMRGRERLAKWARALDAWGFPDLTLIVGERLGANSPEGRPLAYPPGYLSSVRIEAERHGLDPYVMLALIRQESLYRAEALSPVGARGLMQIMPATGREIAAAIGWEGFDTGVLNDPAVSLHFGAYYLAEQIRRFDAFWPAVLAAYNAGPQAVSNWWEFPERKTDELLWIDRIPYRETRNYVKKILANYATYSDLYRPADADR